MTEAKQEPGNEFTEARQIAARPYLMLCLVALVGMVAGLEWYQNDLLITVELISFAPFVLGGLALWLHWSAGPPLLLLVLACIFAFLKGRADQNLFAIRHTRGVFVEIRHHLASPSNFLICASVLSYIIGYYRYFSLTEGIFPEEPRKRLPAVPNDKSAPKQKTGMTFLLIKLFVLIVVVSIWLILWQMMGSFILSEMLWAPESVRVTVLIFAISVWCIIGYVLWTKLFKSETRTSIQTIRKLPEPREAAPVTSTELTALLAAVPIWCVIGYVLLRMSSMIPPPELPLSVRGEWSMLLLCMTLGISVASVTLASSYLARVRATPMQSLLYLQDQLWRETRREQSRMNRWLVRARLRRQHQQEEGT